MDKLATGAACDHARFALTIAGGGVLWCRVCGAHKVLGGRVDAPWVECIRELALTVLIERLTAAAAAAVPAAPRGPICEACATLGHDDYCSVCGENREHELG